MNLNRPTLREHLRGLRPSGPDSAARMTGKYLIGALIGNIIWVEALQLLDGEPAGPSTTPDIDALSMPALTVPTITAQDVLGILLVASVFAAVLPAVYIHRTTPDPLTDRYHWLGVHLSTFVSANIVITVTSVAVWTYAVLELGMTPLMRDDVQISVVDGLIPAVLSSIALPGPYIGILIGRYWSDPP